MKKLMSPSFENAIAVENIGNQLTEPLFPKAKACGLKKL